MPGFRIHTKPKSMQPVECLLSEKHYDDVKIMYLFYFPPLMNFKWQRYSRVLTCADTIVGPEPYSQTTGWRDS
jgi:hypothetical protein